MTSVPASVSTKKDSDSNQPALLPWKILLPYALAIVAQVPMLLLYFRGLWERPHYQPFGFAIIAAVGLAIMRWPFESEKPFHQSLTSDVLLLLGFAAAFMGLMFVEPWFAALSAMLIVASLLARTQDKEVPGSLWACSLPLFVYLVLPGQLDFTLITRLQQYSAVYTSRMLDLIGLGHHMDGTVIKVPGVQEYGIEQACSGVQSFFTLLLVAVVFVVMSRRIRTPGIVGVVVASLLALVCFVLQAYVIPPGAVNQLLFVSAIGLIFFMFLGFRAALLILSAVFWAIFMNTVRIIVIPLSQYLLRVDLSSGIAHDLLGYTVLVIGILLLFSTDQFIYFLFGPVESGATQDSGPLVRFVSRFWNNVISGEEEDETRRRRSRRRREVSRVGQIMIWAVSGLMVAMGLWQLLDVRASMAAEEGMIVRFFDEDPTVDFEKSDLPDQIKDWRQIENGYEHQERTRGSDLGQKSDVWRFQSPSVSTIFSLDQPFPGWHELTTCYTNVGWKLIDRQLVLPSSITGEAPENLEWGYIEARLEKNTGEKGYLLFSMFDAFGNGMEPPADWGTLNSFVIRAQNRLSQRIRASLFQGEAFQNQVFVTSFNELGDDVKREVNLRYIEIREAIRQKFREKRKRGGVAGGSPDNEGGN